MSLVTVQGSSDVNDTYIDQNSATSNFGSNAIVAIGEDNTGSGLYRTLVKYNLSAIPAGSTINSATLTLTVNSDLSSNARTIRVYRVLRAWVDTQATWNVYTTGNSWGTAGCSNTTTDREAADIGTATQPASPAGGATVDIPLTASKIQEMLTGGSFTNNGFLIKVDTETDDAIVYESTQSSTGSARPKLVIDYTVAGGGGSFLLNLI